MQAFRSSGNNDIPANLQVPNRESLLLPDRITPYDNLDLLPAPDVDLLLSTQDLDVGSQPLGRKGRVSNRDINLQEDFNNSQFLQDGLGKDDGLALANVDDLDLDLDFGMDIDEGPTRMTVEMGREAPAARGVEEDIFSEFDLPQPTKDRDHDQSTALGFGDNGVRIHDDDGDILMGDDDFRLDLGDQSAMHDRGAEVARARISESPLSDIDEEFAKEIEIEYSRHANNTDMYEPNDDEESAMVRNAPQRSKKRKIIAPDEQTMLTGAVIKEQQSKHDNILKPQVFLPRDPYLLALMEMQKNGGFVSNVIMDGQSATWAPELKGLLSLDAIRAPTDLKRKRDSGIADMDVDGEQGTSKSPRLEIDQDDPFAVGATDLGNQSVAADGTILEIEGDDGLANYDDEGSALPNFDDTTAPIVHPADNGPVSVGTKHAVHILRDLFGDEAATSAEKRKKTSVVFQELLPEKKTTKADATKMFFECLVLATKDAIKVEQPDGSLGGAIRVRGKRGLWGAWAEREAGGEIDEQAEANEAEAPNQPQPAIEAGSAAVPVSA